jgi:hypothetical protein
MMCPMKFDNPDNWKMIATTIYCEKEKCEWWDKSGKRCALKSVAISLRNIEESLRRNK